MRHPGLGFSAWFGVFCLQTPPPSAKWAATGLTILLGNEVAGSALSVGPCPNYGPQIKSAFLVDYEKRSFFRFFTLPLDGHLGSNRTFRKPFQVYSIS